MEIIVSGRHYQVTKEFKEYSEQLVNASFADPAFRITNVRIVLSLEKERAKADVVVGFKNHDIEASVESNEMGKALTAAIDKAAKQAMKQLEKIQDKKHRTPVKVSEVGKVEIEAEATAE